MQIEYNAQSNIECNAQNRMQCTKLNAMHTFISANKMHIYLYTLMIHQKKWCSVPYVSDKTMGMGEKKT
jgi:hypothetical protein